MRFSGQANVRTFERLTHGRDYAKRDLHLRVVAALAQGQEEVNCRMDISLPVTVSHAGKFWRVVDAQGFVLREYETEDEAQYAADVLNEPEASW